MLRARILLLFEAFAGGFPRPCAVRNMFFMDSKRDVSRVFQSCVLHASSTNLLLLFEAFAGGFPRPCAVIDMFFFMGFKGDVPRVFLACVLDASGTNPAAVRSFRKRFSNAMCRERHVFYGFQR